MVGADEVRTVLSTTDILIALVPAGPENENLFGAEIFESLAARAIFINLGRGSTVDEEALADALRTGTVGAAAIDVAKDEPLTPYAALWNAPNLIITPHVAGNRPMGASALLAENISRLREGRGVSNQIRPSTGGQPSGSTEAARTKPSPRAGPPMLP